MINGQTIGCGIVTYNRPEQLMRLYRSLPQSLLDGLVIINDGQWFEQFADIPEAHFLQNEHNLGVGRSKNKALAQLLAQGHDHYFLIEDDIFILDEAVFEHYIKASLATGIQHFNYSQHGWLNKTAAGQATPRLVVDYTPQLKLPLYTHCVGAFSYYTKACLAQVGLMDEGYVNAFEHVDHTAHIIKAGMHPPFWYFADVPESWRLLGDDPWSVGQSTIASQAGHESRVAKAAAYFQSRHGALPARMPDASQQQLVVALNAIHTRYASLHTSTPRQSAAPVIMRARTELPDMLLAQQYCQGDGVELVGRESDAFHIKNCLLVAPCDGVAAMHPQDLQAYNRDRTGQSSLSSTAVAIDAVGDFQSIPVADQQADYIISAHALACVPNVMAAFEESYRALKDHGIFFAIVTKRSQVPDDACRPLTTLDQVLESYACRLSVDAVGQPLWRAHYQVFSLQSLVALVNHINQQGGMSWYIESFEETDSRTGRGHTLVLRKFSAMLQSRYLDEAAFSAAVGELVERGSHEEALLMLKVSLSYHFFDAAKLHLVALLSHQLGDQVEAVEFLQQALILDPESAECRQHYLQLAGVPYRNPLV